MKCCDEICSLPMMASIFLVFVSVLVIILLVYRAIKPSKNDSVIERQYRFRFGLNVFSMSLCIILLISVLVSSTVKLNSGNVDATDFYTAFIALCTTFVVGFQIYSSIDLNKKIEKLDKEKKRINNQIKELKEKDAFVAAPKWLDRDKNTLQGKVIAMPTKADIDFDIAVHLIVELYSK